MIHDHPYDFVADHRGELTNVSYEEDPSGTEYTRERHSPPDEAGRESDTVLLTGRAEDYSERSVRSWLLRSVKHQLDYMDAIRMG